MRVVVHLTFDGMKEVKIRGDSPFFDDAVGDQLEQKGMGFWLRDWRTGDGGPGTYNRSRVFCPWNSVLYVEQLGGG